MATSGHHANVTECKSSVTLDADVTLEDILMKADYANFLERVLGTAEYFNLPALVCINLAALET